MNINMNSKVTTTRPLIVVTMLVSSLLLSACSGISKWSGKRDNGSLDYQNSKLLAPLQIPAEKQTQTFTPLYPTVNLGESKINTKNATGTQYQLPAPQHTVN